MSKEETLKPYFQTVREQELDKFWHDRFEQEFLDRRRAEIMELAAGMVSGPLSSLDWHEMAMFAINFHAKIEAKLEKKKTNEVIKEVLGHPHLKGN